MKKLLTLFTALLFFGSVMVVHAVTYTPAGTPASVFGGTEWAPDNANNDMVLSNGLYVYAKQDNFASQTAISFKVCKDHGWSTAYPGSNYGFNIPAGSKYLIITYNTSGNAVNAFAISSMTVAGEPAALFGSTWTPSATANDMTLQNDGTYKFEKTGVALSAGTVSFKACANHAWTNAWPSDNYSLSIPESGNYTITITFDPTTLSVSASADLEQAVVVIPTIQLHSNITNPSWEASADFDVAGNEETASLTLTGVTKGNYEFGVKIDGSWTSNGSAFTRDNNSHAVASGSGNCTFNADRNGDYTFTWTYATNTLAVTYPVIPAQSVTFNSLASQILKGSVINLANCVTSSGIDEPTYRFYIKEKNGEYGDAINANYNFNANGEYVVKVEALEYGEPVADDESNVVVYQSYTFTNGSTIYVDFTAVSGDVKGVNYPKVDQVGIDHDANGAGTIKTITFTANVTWTTIADAFIKTGKNGWAAQPFTVPGIGQDLVIVAADGASYTWGTYVPAPPTVEAKGGWDQWENALTFTGDETSVSVTKHLAVGDYEFKMIIGGEWRGNGHTFYRDYTGAANITANDGNMTLEADVEGDYTFTWTYETNALSITFPAEPTPEYAEITFFAPRDETNKWDHVYAYSYKGSRKFLGEWPGTEITSTKNAGWYTVSVRKGSNLIFTDNAGMQTNDILDIQADACYESTSIYYPEDPTEAKKVTVTANAGCEVTYYIAGSKELIGGEADFDTNLVLDENNQIVFHNLAAGTYSFKINNGTWAWALGGNDHLKGGDCSAIAETVGVGDVGFTVDHTQDVTITYYPASEEICLGAETVLDPALAWNTTFAAARIGMENTLPWLNHTLTAGVVYTSSDPSVASFANANSYELTLNAVGTTTITANYYGHTASYKLDVYNFAVPATNIETIGGKFIINAKGDTAVFSRGNLQYDYGQNQWYCAANQYDVLAEVNLHFGDPDYNGVIDLFSWSNAASNYGRLASNKDADFPGTDDFVDWGNVFAGDEKEWSTLSADEWNYLQAHNNWTIIALLPEPGSEDTLCCMVLFPLDWVAPAGLANLRYKFAKLDVEEATFRAYNTFTFAEWHSLFEANGAVALPTGGARAGCVGNKISDGVHETTGWGLNPAAGGWYDHVDNYGWVGYYWLSTQDTRPAYQHCASYIILPGMYEDPKGSDEWYYTSPQVWSREKRRGNSVRLVTRIPRRYTVTYDAGGAAGTVPVDDNTYLPGDNVVLGAQGDLAKDGFTFAGWNDGNATYDAGADYTMPEKDVTLTAQWNSVYTTVRTGLETNRYYTVCLPRQVTDATGATFWNLQYRNSGNTEVYLEEATLPYEAGKPFIIQATADHLKVLYEGDAVLSPVENGALRGTLVDLSESELASKGSDVYLLIQNAIRPITAGNYLDANRAYILYDELIVTQSAPIPAPGKRVRAIPMQGQTATGMDNVQGDDVQCTKVLIDGQMYILRANRMYDVTGKLVK